MHMACEPQPGHGEQHADRAAHHEVQTPAMAYEAGTAHQLPTAHPDQACRLVSLFDSHCAASAPGNLANYASILP